jgi:hypothetical protein
MASKFSDLISYFENIATIHKSIAHSTQEKHFFRMELDEVLSGINRSDVNYPMLILEGYSFQFIDNRSDNLLKKRSGAFILLDHVPDQSDMDAIHEKWDRLEEIGTEIIIRINADKRSREIPVVRHMDFNETQGTLIRNSIGNDVGIRFSYSITSPTPAVLNQSDWTEP